MLRRSKLEVYSVAGRVSGGAWNSAIEEFLGFSDADQD
jgi:hypothetical protein